MFEDVEGEECVEWAAEGGEVVDDVDAEIVALGLPAEIFSGFAGDVEIGDVEAAAGKRKRESTRAAAEIEHATASEMEKAEGVGDVAVEEMVLGVGEEIVARVAGIPGGKFSGAFWMGAVPIGNQIVIGGGEEMDDFAAGLRMEHLQIFDEGFEICDVLFVGAGKEPGGGGSEEEDSGGRDWIQMNGKTGSSGGQAEPNGGREGLEAEENGGEENRKRKEGNEEDTRSRASQENEQGEIKREVDQRGSCETDVRGSGRVNGKDRAEPAPDCKVPEQGNRRSIEKLVSEGEHEQKQEEVERRAGVLDPAKAAARICVEGEVGGKVGKNDEGESERHEGGNDAERERGWREPGKRNPRGEGKENNAGKCETECEAALRGEEGALEFVVHECKTQTGGESVAEGSVKGEAKRGGSEAVECELRFRGAVVHGVENQFDATGDAEFLEDAEEVVADGVLGEIELARDFAVFHPFGNEADNFFLAFAEDGAPAGIHNAEGEGAGKGVEDKLQLAGGGPNLAGVNAGDAAGEVVDGMIAIENPAGTAAESVHDQFAIGFIEKDDDARGGLSCVKLAKGAEAGKMAVVEMGADDGHSGLEARDEFECLRHGGGGANHLKMIAALAALERGDEKLAAERSTVCHNDS